MGQNSPGAPLLSVVVPTRNESGNVGTLVERLARVLAGIPVELVFVDDSSDDTPELLRGMAAAPPPNTRLVVAHREPHRQTGLGSAATEGLKMATGSLVAVMDADLQHPPELLVEMVRQLEARDLDVVVASRYMPGGSARGLNGPARVLVSWASKVVAQLLFREARKTTDPLSGYFLCRRAALDGLEFRPIGFKILLEILVCVASARVGDVPLTFAERHAGRSNASMAQGVAFATHLWSLLLHVPGSARFWKYAGVGTGGLAIFLAVIGAASRLGLGPYGAWALAFSVSLFLNWQLNRLLTFADVASPFTPGRGRPLYLPAAMVGGAANLAVYMLLFAYAHLAVAAAGLGGALAAMAVNFTAQRGLLRRPPRPRREAGVSAHPVAARAQALIQGSAHYLPAPVDGRDLRELDADDEGAPRELLRALHTSRPLVLAEAPSPKPQARSDIGLRAWMAIPITEAGGQVGLLVVGRTGRPFSTEELALVLRSVANQHEAMEPAITPLLAAQKPAH